ncbi:CD226 antigen [Anomaloglossus baeobatrachus]|uniref:CD226 antigen n=1 Tax=Anomaloglossus baeobatrachus TaxID=238106 RepID=UPI003F504B33
MKIIFGMLLLHTIKIVHLEEMVDTTIILRRTITLDCKYSGNGTITQLHWSKVNGSVEETICSVHKSYGKFISPKYMSRLSFVLENSSSDLSITMREASDADIGLYACYVVVYPTGILKKIISVQADDISHTVPTSYQTFRENSKITLNFPYTLMGDVKKVMVEKFADGKKDLVTYCEHPMNGRRLIIYGFDFINHSFVNCSDLQNITLIIHKAIFTTRGLYQCHFWLDVKNHTISVNVELQAIGTHHSINDPSGSTRNQLSDLKGPIANPTMEGLTLLNEKTFRNCSSDEAFRAQAVDLTKRLDERGYPTKEVEKTFKSVCQMDRTDILNRRPKRKGLSEPLRYITTFDNGAMGLRNILFQHWVSTGDVCPYECGIPLILVLLTSLKNTMKRVGSYASTMMEVLHL